MLMLALLLLPWHCLAVPARRDWPSCSERSSRRWSLACGAFVITSIACRQRRHKIPLAYLVAAQCEELSTHSQQANRISTQCPAAAHSRVLQKTHMITCSMLSLRLSQPFYSLLKLLAGWSTLVDLMSARRTCRAWCKGCAFPVNQVIFGVATADFTALAGLRHTPQAELDISATKNGMLVQLLSQLPILSPLSWQGPGCNQRGRAALMLPRPSSIPHTGLTMYSDMVCMCCREQSQQIATGPSVRRHACNVRPPAHEHGSKRIAPLLLSWQPGGRQPARQWPAHQLSQGRRLLPPAGAQTQRQLLQAAPSLLLHQCY